MDVLCYSVSITSGGHVVTIDISIAVHTLATHDPHLMTPLHKNATNVSAANLRGVYIAVFLQDTTSSKNIESSKFPPDRRLMEVLEGY